MIRIVPLLASFGATALLLGVAASPAHAQTPSYRAVPVTKLATADTVVVGDVLWRCTPAVCTATRATARPAIVCAQAARKVGRLESFAAGGTPFDADALAKCNAKAKS